MADAPSTEIKYVSANHFVALHIIRKLIDHLACGHLVMAPELSDDDLIDAVQFLEAVGATIKSTSTETG